MKENRIFNSILFLLGWLVLISNVNGNSLNMKGQVTPSIYSQSDSLNLFPSEFETFENVKRMLAFKLEPTLLFNGDFPLFAEYKLSKSLSLELGLGLTNYQFNHFYDDNSKYISILESGVDNRNGLSLRFGTRYYIPFIDVAISGLYLNPELMFRKYVILEKYTVSGNKDNYFWSDYIQQSLNFNVGYQKIFDSNVIINLYTGVGFQFIKDEEFIKANNGYYDGKTMIKKTNKDSFLIGLRIGYCFKK